MSVLVATDFDGMSALQKFRSLLSCCQTHKPGPGVSDAEGDPGDGGGVADLAAVSCQHHESGDKYMYEQQNAASNLLSKFPMRMSVMASPL